MTPQEIRETLRSMLNDWDNMTEEQRQWASLVPASPKQREAAPEDGRTREIRYCESHAEAGEYVKGTGHSTNPDWSGYWLCDKCIQHYNSETVTTETLYLHEFLSCGPCIELGVVVKMTPKTVTFRDRWGNLHRRGGYYWTGSGGDKEPGYGTLLHVKPCPSCRGHGQYDDHWQD